MIGNILKAEGNTEKPKKEISAQYMKKVFFCSIWIVCVYICMYTRVTHFVKCRKFGVLKA